MFINPMVLINTIGHIPGSFQVPSYRHVSSWDARRTTLRSATTTPRPPHVFFFRFVFIWRPSAATRFIFWWIKQRNSYLGLSYRVQRTENIWEGMWKNFREAQTWGFTLRKGVPLVTAAHLIVLHISQITLADSSHDVFTVISLKHFLFPEKNCGSSHAKSSVAAVYCGGVFG